MIWLIFWLVVMGLLTAALIKAIEETEWYLDRKFWKDLHKRIEEARNDFA